MQKKKIKVITQPITREMIEALPAHIRRSLAENLFGFFARLARQEVKQEAAKIAA